MINLLIDYWID